MGAGVGDGEDGAWVEDTPVEDAGPVVGVEDGEPAEACPPRFVQPYDARDEGAASVWAATFVADRVGKPPSVLARCRSRAQRSFSLSTPPAMICLLLAARRRAFSGHARLLRLLRGRGHHLIALPAMWGNAMPKEVGSSKLPSARSAKPARSIARRVSRFGRQPPGRRRRIGVKAS